MKATNFGKRVKKQEKESGASAGVAHEDGARQRVAATNALYDSVRPLVADLVALQAKARALGMFPNDRGLLECPNCGLLENVACGGRLFTYRPESLDEDTGLRFKELAQGRFRCPACGATVREQDSDVPDPKDAKGGKRPCRGRSRRN